MIGCLFENVLVMVLGVEWICLCVICGVIEIVL